LVSSSEIFLNVGHSKIWYFDFLLIYVLLNLLKMNWI